MRKLRRTDHLALLYGAIDRFSDGELATWVAGRIDIHRLKGTGDGRPRGLLDAVRGFHAASLAHEYFEDFAVNSRNSEKVSDGTAGWTTECGRLFDQCVAKEASAGPAARDEIRDAFRLLFDLLRRVDKGDEIVFFADEGGSWQVGVDWGLVFPCHFRCLAASAEPNEYADEVVGLIRDFARHDPEKPIAAACAAATSEQCRALEGR